MLREIHSSDDVRAEFGAMVASVKKTRERPISLLRSKNAGEYLHALLVGMGIGGLQNLSGARAVMTSSNRVFAQAGIPSDVSGKRELTATASYQTERTRTLNSSSRSCPPSCSLFLS